MNLMRTLLSSKGFRFIVVSGLGWLLDMAVFSALVYAFGLGSFVANLVSGSVGATFAFTISHERIFNKNSTALPKKLAIYLIYTIATIVLASALIEYVQGLVADAAEAAGMTLSHGLTALTAKMIVTPLTLAVNFVVARLTSEKLKL